jgi:hypothetical protein
MSTAKRSCGRCKWRGKAFWTYKTLSCHCYQKNITEEAKGDPWETLRDFNPLTNCKHFKDRTT